MGRPLFLMPVPVYHVGRRPQPPDCRRAPGAVARVRPIWLSRVGAGLVGQAGFAEPVGDDVLVGGVGEAQIAHVPVEAVVWVERFQFTPNALCLIDFAEMSQGGGPT